MRGVEEGGGMRSGFHTLPEWLVIEYFFKAEKSQIDANDSFIRLIISIAILSEKIDCGKVSVLEM